MELPIGTEKIWLPPFVVQENHRDVIYQGKLELVQSSATDFFFGKNSKRSIVYNLMLDRVVSANEMYGDAFGGEIIFAAEDPEKIAIELYRIEDIPPMAWRIIHQLFFRKPTYIFGLVGPVDYTTQVKGIQECIQHLLGITSKLYLTVEYSQNNNYQQPGRMAYTKQIYPEVPEKDELGIDSEEIWFPPEEPEQSK